MAFRVSDDERDALLGLPWGAVTLYLLAIRPRMAYANGMVGERPRVSWQALCEALYIEPGPGRAGGSVHRDQVRRLAWHLERAGLIEFRSERTERRLIFFLPMAARDQSARIKAASKPPEKPAREAARPPQRESRSKAARHPARAEPSQAAQHPVSGKSNPPTTTAPLLNERAARRGGGVDAIEIPRGGLTAAQAQAVRQLLAGQRNGQALADELAGAMAQPRPVANPLGYLRRLIQADQAGAFTSEKGISIAEARERARRIEQQHHAAQVATPPPAPMTAEQLARLPANLRRIVEKRIKHHGNPP